MDTEGLDSQKLHGAPPLMPWQKFADWIGMSDEPIVVRTWLERGYIPSLKVGKRVMVNVALLTHQLLEKEWDA
ncbi:DNA-binding protein [Pseudomonas sp. LRF_L74]|uniref:DNA-binding protein n=1 Tax=Pseudomonas sp. LRF_L74 TaxID=3369422 RepID=UPI003F5DE2EF